MDFVIKWSLKKLFNCFWKLIFQDGSPSLKLAKNIKMTVSKYSAERI